MKPRAAIASLLGLLACAVAACTNGGGLGTIGGGGGGGSPSPLPSTAIGVGIPTGKIGVENDPVWGTVSGYTQNQTSQVLAFPTGTTVTIQNLSSDTPHTLNVIGVTTGPPPIYPKSPSFSFSPTGNGVLGKTYATGILNGGDTVKVKLSNPGIYLIGCAFHYIEFNMRDVIEVSDTATPGPTASPGQGGYAIQRTSEVTAPRATKAPRPAKPAPAPSLVDQLGRTFTLSSLRGTPLAVTFVSAHCTDACPLINAQFAAVAGRIAREKIQARLLTITLDPEHDSLHDMRVLARRFDANPKYWLLSGGSRHDVHAMMSEFGVISVEGKRGEDDRHTTFVYILNRGGKLAKTILASSALNDELVNVLRDRSIVAQR